MNQNPAPVLTGQPAAKIVFRRPGPADIDPIFTLIEEASRTTTVLPRPREVIREQLSNFIVAERDGMIIGCGALSLFTPELAEIRSLVVAGTLRGGGIGAGLVRALVEQAGSTGIQRVFALTSNPAFFLRLGFAATEKATLPHKVWNECVHCPKFLTCTEEAVDIMI